MMIFLLLSDMTHHKTSTVYALSSGHGTCGVSVIRITGALAGRALMAMTSTSKLPPPRHAQLKKLIHPIHKEVLDQALTLWLVKRRTKLPQVSHFHEIILQVSCT